MEVNLFEWLITYVRHRDIIAKEIEGIEKEDNRLIVKRKGKEHIYYIMPLIKDIDKVVSEIPDKKCTIVTLNKKKNFDSLLKNWSRLIGFKNFYIMFVNPFSETEKKWIISPYIHDKIADRSSLKEGLRALFESVDVIK